ncbi:MAG TPA: 23S rRNA (uracil(1939)-C(5))-methyltransferase RlmD [Candidatus Polarisedimenticolaceae bacterium]|nr:23S rRNA (uracil(1939)-C(5))-methyltransferase RlmD [Candidatus Polarisedimenticolaceae bacterium]
MSIGDCKIMGSIGSDVHDVGVELEIDGLAAGGRGVARREGRVWLVTGGLPGQRVLARARRTHARWIDGDVLQVLKASPLERPAPCPFHASCGGCAWMQLPEQAQRAWKRQVVRDALARLAHLPDVPVEETLASPLALGYRNKIELTFGRSPEGTPVLGYHPPGDARRVEDVAACLLADEAMNRVVACARAFFLEGEGAADPALTQPAEPLRLVIRRSRSEARLLAALRGAPGPFPSARVFAKRLGHEVPEVAGVVRLLAEPGRRGGTRVEALAGQSFLREAMGGISFEVPAASFFQVNPGAAETLLREVLSACGPVRDRTALELYGGMGVFGLALARAGARVGVLEADRDAVAAGMRAATEAGLPARFVRGDVLRSLRERGGTPVDLVLADPPRTGLGPGVAAEVAALAPARIVLVSCDPATLARDLGALHARGYAVQRVVPVDLFPQTPHVEAVSTLARQPAA